MIAYKGLTNDLKTYTGFQYDVGVTYTMPSEDVRLCESGFHACSDPMDCFLYYNLPTDVYYKVECNPIDSDNNKSACDSLRLIEPISFDEIIRTSYSLFPDRWSEKYRKITTPSVQNYVDYNGNLAYDSDIENWPYVANKPVNDIFVFEDRHCNTHLWDIENKEEILLEKDVRYIERYDDRYVILHYDDNIKQIYDTENRMILFSNDTYFKSIIINELNNSFVLCDGYKYFIVDKDNPGTILLDNLEFSECERQERFVLVKKNDKYNIYDLYECKVVYDEWMDDISNNLSHTFLIDIGETFKFVSYNGSGDMYPELHINGEDEIYSIPIYSENLNHKISFVEYY